MSDWIEWSGGDCPAPGARVIYKLRGYPDVMRESTTIPESADRLRWSHESAAPDILEYRVVEPARPELPKFDVEKLRGKFEAVYGPVGLSGPFHRALLAVAEYARDLTLNPTKDPVEVLAEKLWTIACEPGFEPALDIAPTPSRNAVYRTARHILETYPDAAERL